MIDFELLYFTLSLHHSLGFLCLVFHTVYVNLSNEMTKTFNSAELTQLYNTGCTSTNKLKTVFLQLLLSCAPLLMKYVF